MNDAAMNAAMASPPETTQPKATQGPARFKEAFLMNPNALVIAGLDTPDGPNHPLYDHRAFLPVSEPLVRNMCHSGFAFGAVEATRINGKYVVVDGRQRVKAAREASRRMVERGLPEMNVRVMVERGDKEDLFEIMVAANHFKQEVDPLSRAELIARYMSVFGKSIKEAALAFGLSTESIRQALKLLDLIEAVKDAIRSGTLSANKALGFAEMSEAEQEQALNEALEGDESAEEIKAKAKRKKGKDASARPGVREIREALENGCRGKALSAHAQHALRWVLGEEKSPAPKD